MKRIITINSNQLDRSLETKKLLNQKLVDAGFEVRDDFHPDTELIISIGGDGSFLKTVHDYNFPQVPIIGINTGHLGFFPEIYPDDIDKFIDNYLNEDYFIQEITLLQADIFTKNDKESVFAINEVVIKGDKSRTIHLNLRVNNNHVQNFSGDGMIVSTPTGSTAYNYAAGGSIVDSSLEIMQLTPLHPINTNAYRCFTSSIIFSNDSTIKIIPEYRFEDSILIVVDGVERRLNKLLSVELYLSNVRAKLLRMSNYEFWGRASEKFL